MTGGRAADIGIASVYRVLRAAQESQAKAGLFSGHLFRLATCVDVTAFS
jgi:hypothetical protein